jgi:Protein of unknwon function (DUF3310)
MGERQPYDAVNPEHYRKLGEYSALHVADKWGSSYCIGNALKYLQRAGNKPGEDTITDLKKAVWYLQREIHQLDRSEPDPAANRGD